MIVTNKIVALSGNLARLRRHRKLTQREVAVLLGIHDTELSRMRDPRLSAIVCLARAVEVKPARLFDGI